jgi:hypothetical protein
MSVNRTTQPAGEATASPIAAIAGSSATLTKPDPKALLAAAKAKKEQAANATPDPSAPESTASVPKPAPGSETPSGVRPDPRAMLAAARAKREADQAQGASSVITPPVPPVEVASAPTPAPTEPAAATNLPASKPDPKAMLAAMKAKKDAAAANSSSAVLAETVPVVAAVKPIPESPASTQVDSITKVPPPSAAQISELKAFYLDLVRPQLPLQSASRRWMETMRRTTLACRIRQDGVHPRFVSIFSRLHDVCEQRRQLAFVERYHSWLHSWLLLHIPATVALYVILVVHVVSALRVIPFGN